MLTCKLHKKPAVAPYKPHILCQERMIWSYLHDVLRRKHVKISPNMTGRLLFNLSMNTHPCPIRPSWSTFNPRLRVHWSSRRQLCPGSWNLRCDAEDEAEELMIKQVMKLCQQMESLCIKHRSFDDSLGLAKHLWQYWTHLNQEQVQNVKPTLLVYFLEVSDVTRSHMSHNIIVNNSHNVLENTLPWHYMLWKSVLYNKL